MMSNSDAEKLYQHALKLTKHEIESFSLVEAGEKLIPTANRALQSGHQACNFVVGDTGFTDFRELLSTVADDGDQVFVDLGCGRGEAVAAALLLQPKVFRMVMGIELMHFKMDECKRLTTHILALLIDCEQVAPELVLLEEDFTKADWSMATVAYACATCFSPAMMTSLEDRFALLKSGARVILLDRELVSDAWTHMGSHSLRTSWGCGTAHVYQKRT